MSDKKQTAIEWLINEWPILKSNLPIWLIEQAKKMEKEQAQNYAEFCVMCDRENLPLLDFESYILTYGGNK